MLFTHGSIAVWAHLPPLHECNEKACSLNGQCTGSLPTAPGQHRAPAPP